MEVVTKKENRGFTGREMIWMMLEDLDKDTYAQEYTDMQDLSSLELRGTNWESSTLLGSTCCGT